jgi:hypothetical protein
MAADTNATVDATQQNFPKMCFWFKRDYMKFTQTKKSNDGITGLNQGTKPRGRVRLQENENVMNDFVELEDGTIVDGTTAESIRAHFRDVFAEQKTTVERMQETMPESWGQASVTFKRFLIREVYEQFPYMRWCDNDWKVHFLATRVYSNWLKAQRKKEARTKVKIEMQDDSGASVVNLTRDSTPPEQLKVTAAVSPISKRKASPALDADTVASAQGSSKRARVEPSAASPSRCVIPGVLSIFLTAYSTELVLSRPRLLPHQFILTRLPHLHPTMTSLLWENWLGLFVRPLSIAWPRPLWLHLVLVLALALKLVQGQRLHLLHHHRSHQQSLHHQ